MEEREREQSKWERKEVRGKAMKGWGGKMK